VSGKSGVKAPHVSAKGLKIEESDSEMELFNTEGSLGKTGKIFKVSAKSGVKAPDISAKGLKIEESDSEMELFNTEGALDDVWSFANLKEQSVSMSL
jgi:hypothetical protein